MSSEFVQEKSVTSWKSAIAAHFEYSHLADCDMKLNKIRINSNEEGIIYSGNLCIPYKTSYVIQYENGTERGFGTSEYAITDYINVDN